MSKQENNRLSSSQEWREHPDGGAWYVQYSSDDSGLGGMVEHEPDESPDRRYSWSMGDADMSWHSDLDWARSLDDAKDACDNAYLEKMRKLLPLGASVALDNIGAILKRKK